VGGAGVEFVGGNGGRMIGTVKGCAMDQLRLC
jgi:hypothetical protein